MSQISPVNKFKLIEDNSKFNQDFIKNYNEEDEEGYFLELDVKYPKKLHELHSDLSFSPDRMKSEIVEKLSTTFNYKAENVIHIRNLKQASNHGLILKRVIE